MAKFIVSLVAPLAREYEVIADDIAAAIQIATSEYIRDFPVAANTDEIDVDDVEYTEAWEIDNDGHIIDGDFDE